MKKLTTFLLSLCLLATMLVTLAVPALAAEQPYQIPEAPTISNLAIEYNEDNTKLKLTFDLSLSESLINAIDYYANHESGYNQVGYVSTLSAQISIDGGEWQDFEVSNGGGLDEGSRETPEYDELQINSYVQFRVKASGWDVRWDGFETEWSNVLKLNEPASVSDPSAGDDPGTPTEPTSGTITPDAPKAEKTKCKVCGICPVQPLGICLFIWLAIILVVVVIVIVVVSAKKKKKKKKKDNRIPHIQKQI